MNEIFQLKKERLRNTIRRNMNEDIFKQKRIIFAKALRQRDQDTLKELIENLEGNDQTSFRLYQIASYDFSLHWASTLVSQIDFDRKVLDLLPKFELECLQLLIALIRGESLSIMYFYTEHDLIKKLAFLLDSSSNKLDILETMTQFPLCFMNMIKSEDRIIILEQLEKHQSVDLGYYYEIISNIAEERFQFCSIKDAIQHLAKGLPETIDYLIKFSQLDEFDKDMIDYEFVNTVFLSLNKPYNHYQQSNLFILLENLIVHSYDLRLLMYACGIFEFLGKQLVKFMQSLKYSVVQEILCCINALCYQADFHHKNNQKSFENSYIENALKDLIVNNDYIDAETHSLSILVLIQVYSEYPFQEDHTFKTQLENRAIDNRQIEQLLIYINETH